MRRLDEKLERYNETADAKKKKDDETTANEKKNFEKKIAFAQGMTSALSTIAQNSLKGDRKNAKLRKGIALGEATTNTALGITKALSKQDYLGALLIGAQGGAQISTIASQKFAKGGIVKGENGVSDIGDKTLVRVNAGEGVFTKEQMKAIGGSRTITIAPTIQVNGNADQSVLDGFIGESKRIADAVIDSIRNGDLDLENELNLVVA
jgi:hypothetical protein